MIITTKELPIVEGGFWCIVADPAWEFKNKGTRAAASDHYEEMSKRDIECLRVDQVAADNAHLYLWTTDSHEGEARELAELWGFSPKMTMPWIKTKDVVTQLVVREHGELEVKHYLSVRLKKELGDATLRDEVGVKLQIGLGNYYRHCHEMVLFCTRGRAPALHKNFPSVFFAERGEHSAKPEILQTMAEQMSPGPGLELFAVRERPYWTCWGKPHRGPLAPTETEPTPRVEIIGSDDNGVAIAMEQQ